MKKLIWLNLVLTTFVGFGCGSADESVEDEVEVGVQRDALIVASASYAGSTVTLGAGNNDAVWIVNQSNSVWADSTSLTATVAHGGALNAAGTGLDHIAIGVRGLSVEGAFQQMGLPLQTGTFLFGEMVASAGLTPANLKALTSGRGITFWAVGAPQCSDPTRPCARFENYTYSHHGPGLIANSVPLNVTEASFQVTLVSNEYNMSFTVKQGGIVKSSATCRALGNNSDLCGQQPDDAGTADAFVAFVNHAAIAGRTVGGTNINVTHQNDGGASPCPGCQPP